MEYPCTCSIRTGRRLEEQTKLSLHGKWRKAGRDLCAHLGALQSAPPTYSAPPFSSSLFLHTSFSLSMFLQIHFIYLHMCLLLCMPQKPEKKVASLEMELTIIMWYECRDLNSVPLEDQHSWWDALRHWSNPIFNFSYLIIIYFNSYT